MARQRRFLTAMALLALACAVLQAVSGDAQYTWIRGILGTGGVSLAAEEKDLGGPAGRFRVIVGR